MEDKRDTVKRYTVAITIVKLYYNDPKVIYVSIQKSEGTFHTNIARVCPHTTHQLTSESWDAPFCGQIYKKSKKR